MLKLSTFVLMYGDYPKLHRGIIDDLLTKLPKEYHQAVSIWCNAVCAKTLSVLKKDTNFLIYQSKENIPKYPVMRYMFNQGVEHPWILWLDDDTRIEAPDWYEKTEKFISDHGDRICFVGPGWMCGDFDRRMPFLKASKWWRNLPLNVERGRTVCHFPIGGYWLLKDSVRKLIDWPDPRLSHNGGDTLLAEAVRQQGLPFHKFAYGIKTQTAPRRGIQERPAGWNNTVVLVVQPKDVVIWRGEGKS